MTFCHLPLANFFSRTFCTMRIERFAVAFVASVEERRTDRNKNLQNDISNCRIKSLIARWERTIDGSWKRGKRIDVWKRTDRDWWDLKNPPGYFCEAFSYIRFLFFHGSNYSIKTNRQPAICRSLRADRDADCVELMSSRTNGITSFTCYLQSFRKALTLFVMMRNVSIPVVLVRSQMAILHNRFHIHSCYHWMQSGKRSIFMTSCDINDGNVFIKLFEWTEKDHNFWKKINIIKRIRNVSRTMNIYQYLWDL